MGGAREVKAPSGKVLGTESGWGKVSSCVSPRLPLRGPCAEGPEENLGPGPEIKRSENEGTRASCANV